MRKNVLVLMLSLALALAFAGVAQAQFKPAVVRLPSYELYAPAKIIVNYVYTNNVTVNVNTLGTTLYKATTSPMQVIFETDAFDVYTIIIDIYYALPVNQTVVIGLFEGGRAAKGIEFDVATDHVSITMKVSVIEQPRMPTAQEISDAMWARWQAAMEELNSKNMVLVDQMGAAVATVGGLAVISFAVCLVAIIVVLRVYRRTAELSEWGIRHEREHRKGGQS